MDLLKAMAIYVSVVEQGSLTAAADACALSPTMVGTYLQSLEHRLGERLLHRTTRRQAVSEFGRVYYDRCKDILARVAESERLASSQQATPQGILRVTAPAIFSNVCLIPALAEYATRYPEVRVDLVVTDKPTDLLDDGFEAAIRIGRLSTPDLVAHPMRPYELQLCASPAYLSRHGVPASIEALDAHQCLSYPYPQGSEWRSTRPTWTFAGPGGPLVVPISGRLQADSSESLRRAALAGMGIAMLPAIMVAEDIREDRLRVVLQDFPLPPRPMHLLHLRDHYMTPKLRSFIDFVREAFSAPQQ